ncbi:MAG TPA: glutamate synthase large subunit [Acidimicrobiales bacterium]|nr:glutamate synthase large subunit [Acidimicrobiales bacterium]
MAEIPATAGRGGAGRVPFALYNPESEHDACGVAFVADLSRRGPSHRVIELALEALGNLAHRGALGADDGTGDGAGLLLPLPHDFLRTVAGLELPAAGEYAAGAVFLPVDEAERVAARAAVERIAADVGLGILGWRDVEVRPEILGPGARASLPWISQVFARSLSDERGMALERRAFVLRKRVERSLDGVYLPSLSSRTLVYKGMLSAHQLPAFYPDLTDPAFKGSLALVHSRFSTNTFPSWPLAHPFRYIAHNGEINTVRGNRNWMQARESLLESDLIPGDLKTLLPICTPGLSDSATFDEVLELLHLAGRSLPHSVLMMVPEAWQHHAAMDEERRAFYEFHSMLMEPWDGPACVTFTDGTSVGAVLDRNGLRPARWWQTDDDLVVMASEVGVLDLPARRVVAKGRLSPGKVFLVDTAAGRVVDDGEVKAELAGAEPYGAWLHAGVVHFDDLPPRRLLVPQHSQVLRQQRQFGYTSEELKLLLAPMARAGGEAIGSMGTDTPIAVLSRRPRLLFDYFTQLFAQVTNPPLDAIREEMVTSLAATIGSEANLLTAGPASCRHLALPWPVIDNQELARLQYINEDGNLPGFRAVVIDGLFDAARGGESLGEALAEARTAASEAVAEGARILILSDRFATAERAPIPSLLMVSAIHHHLIRERTRTRVALVAEAGDAREVHHFALLLGYGAAAVNPYLALETIDELVGDGVVALTERQARANYLRAAGKGVLKVMSTMGISTIASYRGAQVFEALGLSSDVIAEYFTGTSSRLEGIGLDGIAAEVSSRHRSAFEVRVDDGLLDPGGEYQWRKRGEEHLFDPETVFRLQHATREKRIDLFRAYSQRVDEQSERLLTLRGLFRLDVRDRTPVALDEVESIEAIMRRFATGAMSYGSLSAEAHETLAIAMNRIGGRSNSGEGGEDPARYVPDANGDSRRSAVKQVASARFGVTSEYLSSADDIQIKMAQGAKPGEGGQLPGDKVHPWIAKTRHSTPGVGLISPPPHHDIYSIEDLAQLIFDLRNANPQARLSVKLVAETGVGTVAAGVVKADADVVLISGHDGGTGASPLTSLKHAGGPWELGLAETHQTLVANGLRDRVVLQVDGQLRTGRDVVIAALLGAQEYGFSTAPLVVAGCVMMRVCHLDTCPVGIATQDPSLRQRFTGKAEMIVRFFEYVATEVRELLAQLGFRSLDEALGRVDCLDVATAMDHWKAEGLNLSPIIGAPSGYVHEHQGSREGSRRLGPVLDDELVRKAAPALATGETVHVITAVRNTERAVGTLLGHEVTKRFGGGGLPADTILVDAVGSAGQSFGAFVPAGVTLRLEGDANDYVGKGLSGGRIVVRPASEAHPRFVAEENVIAGNVCLYGATGGEAFFRGVVGERFAVRNSGAVAVVEAVGDHACEYMTGGTVLVLGACGRNLGAGMSGGVAYLRGSAESLREKVNLEMVDLDPLDSDDLRVVQSLLRGHLSETGSATARWLLNGWPDEGLAFVKVMPRDLKRALAERAGPPDVELPEGTRRRPMAGANA